MQWPHHGAKNSMRAGFPDSKTTESKFLGVRFRTEEDAAASSGAAREKMAPRRTMIVVVWVGGVCWPDLESWRTLRSVL